MTLATNPTYQLISDHQFAGVWEHLTSKQKSFIARRSYKPGEVITGFSASSMLDHPTYLTVQLGINKHITLWPEHLQFINHSCNPNVFFDTHRMQLVALDEIVEGDELTFFYPSTEWEMAQPFSCHCGSKNCLGEIGGAAQMAEELLAKYQLTEFIQQQLHDRAEKKNRA